MTRILVVDDEEPVRRMISEFLMERGFAVEGAGDGPAGLEAARRARPDLVLLDINMPGMDGVETLRRILAEDPGASVVMISGADDEDLARQALKLGAFDYIQKPVDTRYLEQVIRLWVATRP